MTIYVSSLADMPHLVPQFGVRDLVSIIQPNAQPPTPPGVDPARHHRCPVHDIVEAQPGEVLPEAGHIAELIRFLRTWDGEAPLLIHCQAGVSRSTAVALIAHVLQTGDPRRSAIALREASPYAWPNRRIVALADSILGLDGELTAAREGMGPTVRETDPDDEEVAAAARRLHGYKPGRYRRLSVSADG